MRFPMVMRAPDGDGGSDGGVIDRAGPADGGVKTPDEATGGDGGDAPPTDASAEIERGQKAPTNNYWPEDWQAKITEELPTPKEEAAAKAHKARLEQFFKTRSSPADVLKAALGADSKISELTASLKGMVKLPGKDAKPEEIAAYRKAMGVPEAADKYAVYRPDGFEPSDADTDAEKTFLDAAHSIHLPQGAVDVVLKTYYTIRAQAAKAAEQRAAQAAEAAQEDLRVEYGRDYKANITLADRYLQEHLAPDMGEDWKGLMGLRFADGTALGEKPGFVKAIVKLAKAWADDGPPDLGDRGATVDLDTEIKGMIAKAGTEEYKSPAFQERLDKLIALQNKRNARGE